MNCPWFHTRQDGDELVVLVLDDIGGFGNDCADFAKALGDHQRIALRIDSRGGCSETARQCAQALRGRQVSATITGRCWSAAWWFALAADYRAAFTDCDLMIHGPVVAVMGGAKELRQEADGISKLTAELADHICKRTALSPETVGGWLAPGVDTWMSAAEALRANLITEIIPRPGPLDVPMDGTQAATTPAMTAKENLVFDFLQTLGTVPTTNRDEFLRRLYQWALLNVKG